MVLLCRLTLCAGRTCCGQPPLCCCCRAAADDACHCVGGYEDIPQEQGRDPAGCCGCFCCCCWRWVGGASTSNSTISSRCCTAGTVLAVTSAAAANLSAAHTAATAAAGCNFQHPAATDTLIRHEHAHTYVELMCMQSLHCSCMRPYLFDPDCRMRSSCWAGCRRSRAPAAAAAGAGRWNTMHGCWAASAPGSGTCCCCCKSTPCWVRKRMLLPLLVFQGGVLVLLICADL